MKQRIASLGCIVAGLGVILISCLMPYLISSIYSVASTLLQQTTATRWLWGDWLSTLADPRGGVYRLLVELPICCVGAVSLLLVVLGVVWMIRDREQGEEYGDEEEEFLEGAGNEDAYGSGAGAQSEGPDSDRATW